MSTNVEIQPEIEQYLSEKMKEGFFFRKRITFWRGKPEYIFGKKQRLRFRPSSALPKYDIETEKIKFQIRFLLFFYAFRTKQGYFVPKQNIKIFWERVKYLRYRQKELCDSICANHDEILNEIKRRYIEIAKFKWMNDLSYPGDPPQSFIESFVKRYALKNTQERIRKTFNFEIVPFNPLLDETNEAYGDKDQIIEMNRKTIFYLYLSIALKRNSLLRLLYSHKKKLLDGRHAYKSIVKLCQAYKNTIFYEDNELINKINLLRLSSMNSLTREKDDIINKIDNIIEYVVKYKYYSLGLVYDRKV